jgi:hypothetical protein
MQAVAVVLEIPQLEQAAQVVVVLVLLPILVTQEQQTQAAVQVPLQLVGLEL